MSDHLGSKRTTQKHYTQVTDEEYRQLTEEEQKDYLEQLMDELADRGLFTVVGVNNGRKVYAKTEFGEVCCRISESLRGSYLSELDQHQQ